METVPYTVCNKKFKRPLEITDYILFRNMCSILFFLPTLLLHYTPIFFRLEGWPWYTHRRQILLLLFFFQLLEVGPIGVNGFYAVKHVPVEFKADTVPVRILQYQQVDCNAPEKMVSSDHLWRLTPGHVMTNHVFQVIIISY